MRCISAGPAVQLNWSYLFGIVRLIQVEFHGGVAILGRLCRRLSKLLRGGELCLIQGGIQVHTDAIAELAAEQLIHREVQRLAGQIPERRFHRRQDCHEHAGLSAAEHAALPNLLEQSMDVERALVAKTLAEALDQMVGALNGIDRLATPPDALVRVDLHEQASAHVSALHVRDAQRGRAGRLGGVFDRLSKRGKRARRGSACHRARGEEGTATGGRLHRVSYLISKMYARPPSGGVGPA